MRLAGRVASRLFGVLLQQGALTTSTTAERTAERIHSEVDMWAQVIKAANVKRDQALTTGREE
jgi:type VI protein secretion system component VasF